MSLETGTRVGVYEVTGKLGEGGMGEVYRAHDTTLDRDVALKVLSEAFTADPDRLVRFQREAKVLASLNHPNIGGIHGLESAGETQALVLELIEGPTLADRIAEGPIASDEALTIAGQIAEALEAAHEQGIVHRDLKPANVKLRPDGTVKVLDFGLAKAVTSDGSVSSGSNAPTMSITGATQMGMVVGTAAYMAPEQARGKSVDQRADVWAFGVVLLEMLTGQRVFHGDDVSLTLAKVLEGEPKWENLPKDVTPRVEKLLRRCLTKDPKQRIHALGDVRLALEGAFETTEESQAGVRSGPELQFWQKPVVSLSIVVAVICATGLAMWILMNSGVPVPPSPTRFSVGMPSGVAPGISGMTVSPDGRTVVLEATGQSGNQLHRRALDSLELIPIPGTEGGQMPFFSPDGTWVGFFAEGALRKVSLDGRPPVTLSAVSGLRGGASWAADGTVVFAYFGSDALWQVSENGGDPEPIALVNNDEARVPRFPSVLPDASAALVTLWGTTLTDAEVGLVDLESGATEVLLAGTFGRYSESGHLVYWREGSLWAAPFDPVGRELTGAAVPIVEGVAANTGGLTHFGLSASGTLAYLQGGDAGGGGRGLSWVSRDGSQEPLSIEPQTFVEPRISPDGTTIVVSQRNQQQDLSTHNIERSTTQRLTFDPGVDSNPVWTPDGNRIVFSSASRDGGPGMFVKAADGTGSVQRISTGSQFGYSITPDGQYVLYDDVQGEGGFDIGFVSLDGDQDPERLINSSQGEAQPIVSPDGQWLAHISDENGTLETYVRPFPDVTSGRWQISTGGGVEPVWSRDGQELYYRNGNSMMSVSVSGETPAAWGSPRVIFDSLFYAFLGTRSYDVAPDGRFLMVSVGATPDGDGLDGVVVVENWSTELNELATPFE